MMIVVSNRSGRVRPTRVGQTYSSHGSNLVSHGLDRVELLG